jgi:hypothetical protein
LKEAKMGIKLTTKDITKHFDKTTKTVVNWRQGSTRLSPLPFEEGEPGSKNSIFFDIDVLVDWCKKNKIKIPDSILKIQRDQPRNT